MTLKTLTMVAAAASAVYALPARADNDMYELKTAEAKVAPGAKGTATLTIAAKGGWHVNMEKDAPFAVTLTPDAGLQIAKTSLTRADLAVKTEAAARLDIPFTASAETGKKAINAKLRFIMCREDACKPVKETLALAVDVAAAPPPPAPPAAPATPAAPAKKKS